MTGPAFGMLSRASEAVEITERRFGLIPQAFLWSGHLFRVQLVEKHWVVHAWLKGSTRQLYRVRCAEGVFELCHDLALDAWCICHGRRPKALA